jgi:two-component system LytT family response regulator
LKSPTAIRAIIVEDEPLARRTIMDFLEDEDWLELVGEATDGNRAVRMIDDLRPDLVFLDVKIPGLTGLQVLETIKHDPEVVFTTAYDTHAVTAFELDALDYILKPFGHKRFHQMLERVRRRLVDEQAGDRLTARERALHALRQGSQEYLVRLFVRNGRGRIDQVHVEDITRFQGADDYVEIHANGTSHLVHVTLSECEKHLDPKHFRRVHRSVIVNLNHLLACEQLDRRLRLKLSDGSEVIASRSGSQNLRDLIV